MEYGNAQKVGRGGGKNRSCHFVMPGSFIHATREPPLTYAGSRFGETGDVRDRGNLQTIVDERSRYK